MRFTVDPEAAQELFDATFHYEIEREGLGEAFAREMRQLIREICENPGAWPAYTARTRRHRSTRFPYAVIYQVLEQEIHVVAIAHGARRPGYWRKRLRRGK